MDTLNLDEFKNLMEKCGDVCVSIFMPTHKAGPESQQDPIRLKNLIKKAEDMLLEKGLRSPEAKAMLQPAQDLVQDGLFWSHQNGGLAIFLSREHTGIHVLPSAFEELVVVADRFHVKPILPLMSTDARFYVLAVSQNQIRLLKASRFNVEELELEGIPENIDDALQYDEFAKQLQWHAPRSGPGKQTGIFHGHGSAEESVKDNILRYLRLVDKGLRNLLGTENAPLVFAGVEYLFPIYKEANTYPNLLDKPITGNPESWSAQELHSAGWKIVEPYFKKKQQDAVDRYWELVGTGKTSKDLQEIVVAAHEGRIDTLFVSIGLQRWGVFDPDTNTVHLHPEPQPGDEDLLDFAAIQTFVNGGKVFAVEPEAVPDDRNVAAIFRY